MRIRRWLGAAAVAAAMVVVAWGISARWPVVVQQKQIVQTQEQRVSYLVTHESRVPAVRSRPPTRREQLMMRLPNASPDAARTSLPRKKVEKFEDPVELLRLARAEPDEFKRRELCLRALRHDPAGIVPRYLELVADRTMTDAATSAMLELPAPPTRALFDALDDPRVPIRLAAAKLLGKIDGPETTRRLAEMVRLNINRREALVALIHNDSADAAEFLSEAARDSSLAAVVRSLEIQYSSAL
jgi:hypothetical protein